jgi:hypothetical protein
MIFMNPWNSNELDLEAREGANFFFSGCLLNARLVLGWNE